MRTVWTYGCLFLAVLLVPIAWGVDADSTTWEGAYEADAMPNVEVGFSLGGWHADDPVWDPCTRLTTAVAGGICRINTESWGSAVAAGEYWFQDPLSLSLDFSDGSSVEFSAKVTASGSTAAAAVSVTDVNGDNLVIGLDTTLLNITNVGNRAASTTDNFHVYRVTVSGSDVQVYRDGQPFMSGSGFTSTGGSTGRLTFGDLTGAGNSDWEINYIRWTDAGAFAPPTPPCEEATCESITWCGSYEADDAPDLEKGFAEQGGDGSTTVADGLCTLDTIDGGGANYLWWELGGTMTPAIDLTTGATLEFRAKVIDVTADNASAAGVTIVDSSGVGVIVGLCGGPSVTVDDYVNFSGVGLVATPVSDDFHTYRITMESGTNGVKLYVDDDPSPIRIVTTNVNDPGLADTLRFGDFTGGADAEWVIDYIRWTEQGIFPPCRDANCPEATSDSATWCDGYEGDDDPDVEHRFIYEGMTTVETTVVDGICNFNSNLAGSNYGWWVIRGGLFPEIDFSTGGTLEFRARVNMSESNAAAAFTLIGINGKGFTAGLDENLINFTNFGNYALDTTDDFHVYRITGLEDTADPNNTAVRVYVDGDETPVLQFSSFPVDDIALANSMRFGDLTGGGDADVDIDYIRWTDEGAIPPPGPPAVCGDDEHPYPAADWAGPGGPPDCMVDLFDFAYFVATWLNDTRP